ncbi:periplasmic heavy metal sensor [Fulvivirga sediminis]|uniref:Periplasmic heavy metal sensor n=1 Tax=Fulvivirga sediminis TaxID=2803949 RepID=A0A937F651_9BACT|nr:periplasmic heavy metal sensor [Fulvivirga sediminis]MBL3656450.1 periplasmic heavy metal sensor [Fulvivirga sediminis]
MKKNNWKKMNKNRLLTGLVIVLAIMNVVLLSFLWFSRSDKKTNKRWNNQSKRVESFFDRKLNLTESQSLAFEKERKDHFKTTLPLVKEIQADKRKMVTMLGQGVDSLHIEAVLQSINEKNNNLERLNFWHIKTLREICTDEQKPKFDKIINRIGSRNHRQGRKAKGM